LGSLVGDESKALSETVQPDAFARDVLGFEEIEDEEEATQEGVTYENQESAMIPGEVEEKDEEEGSPEEQLKGKSSQEL
jgi:hypothetical protein